MTSVTVPRSISPAPTLQRLYFVRFGFAIVWAALLALTASELGVVAWLLLVLYPAFDVLAAVVDSRASRATGSVRGLYLNMAISTLAAVGLAIAATSDVPAVLRVWGVWAIVAGLIQLVVGISRRRSLGGQWAMIISGALSALAGTSFIIGAAQDGPSPADLAGYAVLDGIFFLVSAIRLGRAAGDARRH